MAHSSIRHWILCAESSKGLEERSGKLELMLLPFARLWSLHCKCLLWPSCASFHIVIGSHSVSQKFAPVVGRYGKWFIGLDFRHSMSNRASIYVSLANRFFGGNNNWNRKFTSVLRHFQSLTRGCPAGRTLCKTSGPFSIPNSSFPISLMLLSKWTLCDIASKNCFWASSFLGDPSGALRTWIKKKDHDTYCIQQRRLGHCKG